MFFLHWHHCYFHLILVDAIYRLISKHVMLLFLLPSCALSIGNKLICLIGQERILILRVSVRMTGGDVVFKRNSGAATYVGWSRILISNAVEVGMPFVYVWSGGSLFMQLSSLLALSTWHLSLKISLINSNLAYTCLALYGDVVSLLFPSWVCTALLKCHQYKDIFAEVHICHTVVISAIFLSI